MKISGSPFLKEIRFTTDTARREDGGGGRSFPFAAGELVHGEVTGMTPEGKVLLTIGGVTIEAKSEVALKVGGEFWFEVRQAGTEPWLALAETKGAVQEVVRQLATGAPALGRLLPTLVAMVGQDETLPPETRAQLATLLPTLTTLLAQHGGLPPETRAQLATLLPTLTTLLAQRGVLPPETRTQLATLLPTMTTLLAQHGVLPSETRAQLATLLPALTTLVDQGGAFPAEARAQLAVLLPALTALLDQGEALPSASGAQFKELVPTVAALAQGAEPAPEKLMLLLASLQGEQSPVAPGAPLLDQLTTLLGALPVDGAAASTDAATIARSHALLAAMAHCNQQVPAQHQPLFWFFPCFFAMGEGAGSWLLQTAAEEGPEGKGGYTLSFFLEMSRLGEVQLQVAVKGEEVRGAFALADEAAVAHLRQALPELKERLAALGYRVGPFSCSVARERLLPGLKRALEEAAALAPTRLLDVKA